MPIAIDRLREIAEQYHASLVDDTAPVPRLVSPTDEEKRVVLAYLVNSAQFAGAYEPVLDSYCDVQLIVPIYMIAENDRLIQPYDQHAIEKLGVRTLILRLT